MNNQSIQNALSGGNTLRGDKMLDKIKQALGLNKPYVKVNRFVRAERVRNYLEFLTETTKQNVKNANLQETDRFGIRRVENPSYPLSLEQALFIGAYLVNAPNPEDYKGLYRSVV